MVPSSSGAVVLVPFPFSDLSHSKLRPALVLADAGRGDYILAQITSRPWGDPKALALLDTDFSSGALRVESFLRPGKLFTANASLIVSEVGVLSPVALRKFREATIALLTEAVA